MKKTAFQIAGIIIVSTVIGLVYNALALRSIDIFKPPVVKIDKKGDRKDGGDSGGDIQRSAEPEYIDRERAYELYEKGAVFLDARDPSLYEEGRIKGAVLLPYEMLDTYLPTALERIYDDPVIVTYCDGSECDLSVGLAYEMTSMEFSDVNIFFDGWSAWKEAGYPTESGVAE